MGSVTNLPRSWTLKADFESANGSQWSLDWQQILYGYIEIPNKGTLSCSHRLLLIFAINNYRSPASKKILGVLRAWCRLNVKRPGISFDVYKSSVSSAGPCYHPCAAACQQLNTITANASFGWQSSAAGAMFSLPKKTRWTDLIAQIQHFSLPSWGNQLLVRSVFKCGSINKSRVGREGQAGAHLFLGVMIANGISASPSTHAERPGSMYTSVLSVVWAKTFQRTSLDGHLLCAFSSRSCRDNIAFLCEHRLCALGRSSFLMFTPQCKSAEMQPERYKWRAEHMWE